MISSSKIQKGVPNWNERFLFQKHNPLANEVHMSILYQKLALPI